MKKKLLKAINILARLIAPIISAFIGLWFLSVFNIFDVLIEDPGTSKDIGITVYFSVSDILINLLFNYIGKVLNRNRQTIEVIFHNPKDKAIIENTPTIKISGDTPTKMQLTIKASAQKKLCKDLVIKVLSSRFYTMQLEKPCEFAEMDQSGNLIINISKLFGEQTSINATTILCVLLIKDQDVETKSEIKPELNKTPILTDFSFNKANVEIR